MEMEALALEIELMLMARMRGLDGYTKKVG
jgi:hypothetical protein